MPKYDVWVRHVMDERTKELVGGIGPEQLDVCEISGSAWHDMYHWKSFTEKHYPDFDLCRTPFDREYDLIICEQVLEHVRYPWDAVKNIFNGLKRGGYALLSTPFMYHIHPTPLDGWRWTPQGMGFLLEDAGFLPVNIVTEGWGNYEVFLHHAMVGDAPGYNGKQAMNNVDHIPVQVWGFAKKH